MLSVGDLAPAFRGTDQHGREVVLADLVRFGPVVLYFYPKDFTRICTQQACLFRDVYEELAARQVSIVGVSLDNEEAHARFSRQHELPFSLLADPGKKIARAYDALQLFRLFTKRVTYVIDRRSHIAGVFHYELSAEKHLADLRRLLEQEGSL